MLEAHGVEVIGNSLGIDTGVDVPAVPATIVPAIRNGSARTIIDLGGDPAGARALRQFRPHIPPEDTDFLFLVNAYRAEVATVESARAALTAIEHELTLNYTGIVNNSHLLHETVCDNLRVGDELCRALSDETGIPVRFYAATAPLLAGCGDSFAGTPITITETLREGWMKRGNQHAAAHKPRRPPHR